MMSCSQESSRYSFLNSVTSMAQLQKYAEHYNIHLGRDKCSHSNECPLKLADFYGLHITYN